MIRKTLTVPLFVISIATAAAAQDASIDTNGDGMYSYPELLVLMPEMTEADFTVLDGDGDGLLNADEIAAGTEAGILPAMDG